MSRTRPFFSSEAAVDFVRDFFFAEKNLLSFQRTKRHSLFSQKNPFLLSVTAPQQRGQGPTVSRSEGNRTSQPEKDS